MQKIEGYVPGLLGLLVFAVLIALNKTKFLVLSEKEIDHYLIDAIAAFTIAFIADGFIRERQFRKAIQDELKRGLNDNTKLIRFRTAEDAYDYLTENLPRARVVRNTIIHTDAYSASGISPRTKSSEAYNKQKHQLIKRGSLYWEDIISSAYRSYIDALFERHFSAGKSQYAAFILRRPIGAFQNFTILEYADDHAEVVIGWIITYGSIASGQDCFLVANSDLVRHYQQYFAAIRDNNCNKVERPDT